MALALGLALLPCVCAIAQVRNNPGYDRPGLGFTPAVLRAGDVTWEQGLPDWDRAGGALLYTADSLLRLGMGGPFELQFGTSYNRLSVPGTVTRGRGDSSLGLKFALPATGKFGWGLLGNVTLTDGTRDFRGQARQYLLGTAFNWQLDPRDALGAYMETVRGDARNDHLVAFNAGRTLDGSLGAYVEVAWQQVAGAGHGGMAGAGLAWQLTPRVQLDISARHRIAGHADTWQGGLGFAVYFGD